MSICGLTFDEANIKIKYLGMPEHVTNVLLSNGINTVHDLSAIFDTDKLKNLCKKNNINIDEFERNFFDCLRQYSWKESNVLLTSPRNYDDTGEYKTRRSPQEIQDYLNTIKNINPKETTRCGFCVFYNLEEIKISLWEKPKVSKHHELAEGAKPDQLIIKINPNYIGAVNKEYMSCPVHLRPNSSYFYGFGDPIESCTQCIRNGECHNPLIRKYIGEFLFPMNHQDESKKYVFTKQQLRKPVKRLGLSKYVRTGLQEYYNIQTLSDAMEFVKTRGIKALPYELIQKLERMNKNKTR